MDYLFIEPHIWYPSHGWKKWAFSREPIKVSLQYCSISLHFIMYFFILEVKIPSKCQNFLGSGNQVPEFPIFSRHDPSKKIMDIFAIKCGKYEQIKKVSIRKCSVTIRAHTTK